MTGVGPPANFASAKLHVHTVGTNRRFGRIYPATYPDPVGYGKSPSRFSDPRRRKPDNRFGVLYTGASLGVCFLEAVIRDKRDGIVGPLPIAEHEVAQRRYAEFDIVKPLRTVDLRANGAVAMGVPAAVCRGDSHTLSRAWSVAFYEHPSAPDGIVYPSRLNGQSNLAVYDRAIAKLAVRRLRRLIDVDELAPLLDKLRVALVEPD